MGLWFLRECVQTQRAAASSRRFWVDARCSPGHRTRKGQQCGGGGRPQTREDGEKRGRVGMGRFTSFYC